CARRSRSAPPARTPRWPHGRPPPDMAGRILAALALEFAVLAMCLVVTLDLSAHRKVERVGGVNIWNYRGPVAHQKQPREIRLAFVGGTRAFSWGVAASETVPASVGWMVKLAT